MNSDLSRLISLRCVMSSSSVTAPTSLVVGVLHRRRANAKRPPGAVDRPGQHGGGTLRRDRGLRPQHVDDGLRNPRIARDLADWFAKQLRSGAEQALGRGIDPRDQTGGVGDEHRVVERINGGLGRLLRDEQFAEI